MNLQTQTVQRLMEIGFLAAGNNMESQANRIFDAVAAARPDSEMPNVGRAITALNKGHVNEAIELLRQAVERNSESEMAMTFLGLALKLGGMGAASEDALRQVVNSGGDPAAIELASSLLVEHSVRS
ncbi:MAG: HrpB1 family type III secretion system apparatus protein [Planctomycetota bacterium]